MCFQDYHDGATFENEEFVENNQGDPASQCYGRRIAQSHSHLLSQQIRETVDTIEETLIDQDGR